MSDLTIERFTICGAHTGKVYAADVDEDTVCAWLRPYVVQHYGGLNYSDVTRLEVGESLTTASPTTGLRVTRIR